MEQLPVFIDYKMAIALLDAPENVKQCLIEIMEAPGELEVNPA